MEGNRNYDNAGYRRPPQNWNDWNRPNQQNNNFTDRNNNRQFNGQQGERANTQRPNEARQANQQQNTNNRDLNIRIIQSEESKNDHADTDREVVCPLFSI